ncbi:hypothetical protein [Ruegeria arenilitoris]|uniref:hypothetical protein n=1 Tax=Ruegeria arenilitoris TaxID=1173585 RepID=UPI00147D1CB9|nr:hypothetical protein [Ruegeria arenilitoris]
MSQFWDILQRSLFPLSCNGDRPPCPIWSTRLDLRARMGKAILAEASFGCLSLFEDNVDATDAFVFRP